MATSINNWMIGSITAIALLIGSIFFWANAKEKNQETIVTKKVATTTWHFTGNDPSEILNPANWQEGPSEESCETDDVLELPCTFETNVSIADAEALIDYFESEYPSDTQEQVVENAVSTRNPE